MGARTGAESGRACCSCCCWAAQHKALVVQRGAIEIGYSTRAADGALRTHRLAAAHVLPRRLDDRRVRAELQRL